MSVHIMMIIFTKVIIYNIYYNTILKVGVSALFFKEIVFIRIH